MEFYAAVQKLDHYPKSVESFLVIGEKFQAWTLLRDAQGQPFKTFDAFCEAPIPYGLGCAPGRIRDALARVQGKQAAELLTVAPDGRRDNRRGGKGIDSSGERRNQVGHSKDAALRAILRAPAEVQDLYRAGLISQKAAAKLGPKCPDEAAAHRIVDVVQALRDVPRERRAIESAVRAALGEPERDPVERLLERARRFDAGQWQRLLGGLRPVTKAGALRCGEETAEPRPPHQRAATGGGPPKDAERDAEIATLRARVAELEAERELRRAAAPTAQAPRPFTPTLFPGVPVSPSVAMVSPAPEPPSVMEIMGGGELGDDLNRVAKGMRAIANKHPFRRAQVVEFFSAILKEVARVQQ